MGRSRLTARSASEWGAVLPQWLGMLGLVFCLVFWAATDRVEPLLVTTFGGLLTVGLGAEAVVALKSPPAVDRSPPDDPAGGARDER